MNPLTPEVEARFHGLRRLIGNTPLLAVEYTFRGKRRRVFAKSENLNMTGSVKDRMALHIMRRAYETGAPSGRAALIVEATSGNTGISFAAVGRALGHPVAIFMPDWMSTERVNLIRSFGAKIHPVSKDERRLPGQHPAEPKTWRPRRTTRSCPGSSPTRTTARPTRLPRGRRSTGSWADTGCAPTRSWPASAPAAPSWGWGVTCGLTTPT